jgi:NitT/TauT family transport system substrate-binding protein
VLLAGVLSGCGFEPDPLLRVATHVWPGYELLYLAREQGYYDERPIRLVELTSATETASALRTGAVEAGALTLDETLRLFDRGIDVRIVLVFDDAAGVDVLLARPDIAELTDLRGRRIGAENGAVGALMLDAVLRTAGLTLADITLAPLTVDEQLAAYRAGQVDAVVTFEPVATQLRAEGARPLFDGRQVPNQIMDVLVVRGDALPRHGKALEWLIAGYFRALRDWRDRAPRVAPLLAPRLGLTPPEVIRAFRGLRLLDLDENRQWLAGAEPILERTARTLGEQMVARRLLRSAPPPGPLVDARWLPAARP